MAVCRDRYIFQNTRILARDHARFPAVLLSIIERLAKQRRTQRALAACLYMLLMFRLGAPSFAFGIAPGSVAPLTGISVEIEESRDPTRNGVTLRYRVIYKNESERPVSDLTAKAVYDPRLTFLLATPPPDAGTTDQWTVGTLEPGQHKAMIIRLRVSPEVPDGALLRTEISLRLPGGENISDYEISAVRAGSHRSEQ